ncbi:SDR family NAD(P)-dependent oxidoreductase [Streptomyces sp. NPDC058289]|uniref:SDR family NAD(P)-dependent oxidoreductase n=1 Tax=Streptomyces sp. NPDC058289 TaxID=3346425 RepID=UPI0036EC3E8E
MSGSTGLGSSIAYCAAKAGLDVMTTSLARVLGPQVRVLNLSPAAVDTGFVPGRGPYPGGVGAAPDRRGPGRRGLLLDRRRHIVAAQHRHRRRHRRRRAPVVAGPPARSSPMTWRAMAAMTGFVSL